MIASDAFRIRWERHGRVHRLIPTGELDIATTPILERAFEAAYKGDATMIVVDLTELSFIDSTGIGALIRMNDSCEAADRLRVVNGSPAVVKALDITGVRRALPIISIDDDPLAAVRRED